MLQGIGLRLIRKYGGIGYKIKFIFLALFKRKRLQCKKSFGTQNLNKVIYVVRPDVEDSIEGLLSLVSRASIYISYAQSRKYLVYVDWENFTTQYSDGVNNAWEFFFEQPSNLNKEEVYNSKKVYFSGWTWKDLNHQKYCTIKQFYDRTINQRCHQLLISTIKFNKNILAYVQKESELTQIEECIGLYIRGTDYIGLKPSGEYIQPSIEQVIPIIKEFLKKYESAKLFLVTEDGKIYKKLKTEFHSKLIVVSYDTFIYNYPRRDFLSKSNVLDLDKKRRGINYLVKMILLSRCRYLISSITMGSMFSYALNGNCYKDEYIFDLGIYL